jgi:bifunctional enzyme CysN/CysC
MGTSEPARQAAPAGPRIELLRFSAVGSVDDGKSTLIGRLLYETNQIFDDQLTSIERASSQRGRNGVDLALLLDGLRAEREQGITIDVAYRSFRTRRRRFIIADTPGHLQYTRNMVTGASRADLVIILVDARLGVVEQTRRHAFAASLLRVPHFVVAINKMDLVGYAEDVFDRICADFGAWASRLDIHDLRFIPLSALHGENIVRRSPRMPWYEGPTLLYHLERVHIASDRNLIDARFPVQWVNRPQLDAWHDYRGYAGRVASGVLNVGDDVVVLPSGYASRIEAIEVAGRKQAVAYPPLSVTLRLAHKLDVSRGDMFCRPQNRPLVTREVEAMVWALWETPIRAGGRYLLKHTTRTVRAVVEEIRYGVDVNSLHRRSGIRELAMNDVGRVHIRTSDPIFIDEYRANRETGAFILIDEATYDTVGAGMVAGSAQSGWPASEAAVGQPAERDRPEVAPLAT